MRNSIVLALSDDPAQRGRAMSAGELKTRAMRAYEDWGAIMARR